MVTDSRLVLAVDSDGCVLDAMRLKHRLCFAPAIVEVWALESVRELVVEESLRLNLHSPLRGANRFQALAALFRRLRQLLPEPPGASWPATAALDRWVARAPVLAEPALAAVARAAEPADRRELERLLRWTREVNRRVALLAPPQPFAGAQAALAQARALGMRVVVVSSATRAVISAEWQASGLDRFIDDLFAQEDGSKAQVLRALAAASAEPPSILMVGDAPGDRSAAAAAGALFFPIVPGAESEAWQALGATFLKRWATGAAVAADLDAWVARFDQALAGEPGGGSAPTAG
jgi:phosphoglycolate phosphatase-like HAD superfamily hydrolase